MAYNSERTRAALYAAGVAEFAAHGLAGARVDRIARNAGVDKKAIYLYFGDKRALFEAVLAHELDRLAQAVPLDPDDIPDYVGRLFDYHVEHPEYLRLMQWEALELAAAEVPGEAPRTAHYRGRIAMLGAATVEAEISGPVTKSSASAANLWLALAGMVSWAFAAPQLTRMVLGEDVDALEYRRDKVVDYTRRLMRQPD